MSRRSPASAATRSQCRPAQLMTKVRFEGAGGSLGHPFAAGAAQPLDARAGHHARRRAAVSFSASTSQTRA